MAGTKMYPTVGESLTLTAEKYPDRDAIVYPQKNQEWSYREFNERVNQLAHALCDLGIEKGDRVSTFLFNTSEMILTCYSAAKIGAVFNPINFRLAPSDLTYILNDAESSVLLYEDAVGDVVDSAQDDLESIQTFVNVDGDDDRATDFYSLFEKQPKTEPEIDVEQDDRYIIMYSSGTTGRPKGIVHSHRDMIEHNMCMLSTQHLSKTDVGLSCGPLYHSAELHCMLLPRVHVGASTVLQHAFDPEETLGLLEEHDVSVMFGAPTMWIQMVQQSPEEYDLSSFRLGVYGGASMAPATIDAVNDEIGCDLVEYYGMTEFGPAVTVLPPDGQDTKAGAAGISLPNHEVKIVELDEDGIAQPPNQEASVGETGEIVIRGPAAMDEYWNMPEKSESVFDGEWYYSGDLGYCDADGYIWKKDRADDMFISGGENIYPRDTEDVLLEHDSVVECAVVGKPDDEWGKVVLAYVVADDVTEEELDEFLKEHDDLADYKRPREHRFVEELPKTASGKIQKFELRDRLNG
ncbi:long-chain-fatty-acid--CoA ligase [Halococcus thailandensis]|uniref:Long-chain-fatty-acid--CoA ligase n=1 Tax=Halococcus thailandensis JCM 13552 TaxID=1227457 RepID=M0NFX1_9EURY|nr:long-chain-fatty-acid--CoA ligase [Halococcus thailandensis]EMA56882.1 long-chain-fatty-acid--CoA ligase [Halococcus thailandensis JCM 13552]